MIPAEPGVNFSPPPQILAEFEAKPAPSAQFSDLSPDLILVTLLSYLPPKIKIEHLFIIVH